MLTLAHEECSIPKTITHIKKPPKSVLAKLQEQKQTAASQRLSAKLGVPTPKPWTTSIVSSRRYSWRHPQLSLSGLSYARDSRINIPPSLPDTTRPLCPLEASRQQQHQHASVLENFQPWHTFKSSSPLCRLEGTYLQCTIALS